MISIVKNCIGKILEKRGYPTRNGHFVISDNLLKEIGISAKMFNIVVDNKAELTVTQAHTLARLLAISVDELYRSDELKLVDPLSSIPFITPR